ncbi:MAG: bifunctional UDP-N-acetylmuramoyl-tripeptide:D-alanyl-D-alanine ligase/alanine racemase [Muribaculaceae bacterium]|nr:bifunctional UDP-N-acetylmuramoyl-tripeptide:D-alanyl-D-alanine ligase/alanine racemase [Muribaculaceae bacterium]
MSLRLSEIATILHHNIRPEDDREISILLTDSRSLTFPEQSLFFALSTASGNGHHYIPELYSRSVRDFVVSEMPDNASVLMPDAVFIKVADVTRALQEIGRMYRMSFDIPVIGITGSQGKTTVKEWLYQLLSHRMHIVRSPRSFNSQIGVPLSIWEMDSDTELAIFEAGISRPVEMSILALIIRPTIGIITNIGPEHAEGFSSITEKAEEKAMLLSGCQYAVYNGDNDIIHRAVIKSGFTGVCVAWSVDDNEAPLYVSSIIHGGESTTIVYSYLRRENTVTIPFTSESDIQNAIHCIAVLHILNIPVQDITEWMGQLTPVGTRMEVIEGVNNCMVIHDSYTSDLHSLTPALDFMRRRATASRTSTVILSDVMHESMPGVRLYKEVAKLLIAKGVSRIIGIGEEISRYSRFFPAESTFYDSTTEFLSSVSPGDFDHELVLIKGASQFHFELIAEMLEARQHETVLEVNLDALVHNFNFCRSFLKPSTGVVCMVKASGYGAGAHELAKTLQSQGAAYLAVAVADEGVDLRKAGITMPIMVMNPRVVNYHTLFAFDLEPEIYTFEILHQIIREAEKYGVENYPVHIKIDSGMHRLGFLEDDIPELVDILKRQKAVRPASVFSHLCAADCPDMDDYTMEQFAYFDRCANALQRGFNHHIQRHILNSTGITRFPEYQYDLVRLGICLYGVPTMTDGSQDELKPVSALYTTVISIKEWEAGTTIGYSRRGVLKRQSRIATIPVGYADGIDRHLGNGNLEVYIGGRPCPTVGNVCMDIMMVDVTDTDCSVGDRVELFGPNIPVTKIAETLDTIPYEVLTSVSTRVKRIYYRE